MFAVDDEQRIVNWSTSAEQLFGRTADDAVGRLCFEVLGAPESHSDCRPGCRLVLEARHGRAIAHPDIHAHHADGHSISLRASSFIMPGEAGDPGDPGASAQPIDGPSRAERPVIVHLVRAKAGSSRRARPYHEPTTAGRQEIPALVSSLTTRELEVLHLLAVGRGTQQIADELRISRLTARNHVLSIEQKLGAHSRVAAVFLARHHGLI